ncbi:MAG TPA: universal stress protein [Paraburkholderia sp.]|nr:universal stress protein [Paraburkholderia sp.]
MYRNILAPIDGSAPSSRAFSVALQLARDTGARLQPLYAVDVPLMSYDVPGYDPSYVREALFDEGQQVIDDALARMKSAGVPGTPRILDVAPLDGDIAEHILKAAKELPADLVVMGTHGRRGVRRLVLGSVAERFLRLAHCPVLMVPAQAEPEIAVESGTAPQAAGERS